MTSADKLATVKILIGNTTLTDSALSTYIQLAGEEMCSYMGTRCVPDTYASLQCKLASRMVLRRGTEGEITHNEGGSTSVNRTYGSVDDVDIFSKLPRRCVLVGGNDEVS